MFNANVRRAFWTCGGGEMSVLRNLIEGVGASSFEARASERFLLISDVAEKVEMEPKTIRFYEKVGLLKPGRLGQLRVFESNDVEVLLLVKKLRQYGMPIAQVREALTLHQQENDSSDNRIKALLSAQLALLVNKHRELAEQIAALDFTLSIQSGTHAA
jgi:MerR family transcriptional regulator, copper efflux regulator